MQIGQSLIIRGFKFTSVPEIIRRRDTNAAKRNLQTFFALLRAIVPRLFKNIQYSTLAWDSHQENLSSASEVGSLCIEVEDVAVKYGPRDAPVLQNLSFKIDAGEFVYLGGADSIGKTTLLKAIAGVIPGVLGRIKGRIRIGHQDIGRLSLRELSNYILYIPSDPLSVLLGITVGEEMLFRSPTVEQAKATLQVMGIGNLWDEQVTELSGGQQVRLILAGTLASNAQCLVFDDPMQQLDPAGRVDFLKALAALRESGRKTIVIASEYIDDLVQYISSVIVLESSDHLKLLRGREMTEYIAGEALTRRLIADGFAAPLAKDGPIIAEARGLSVRYHDKLVLKDFDFSIRSGEIVAILGANGSGKTTAMLALAGVIKYSAESLKRPSDIGLVFQDVSLQMIADTTEKELAISTWQRNVGPEVMEKVILSGLTWAGLDGHESPIDLHPTRSRLLGIAAMSIEVDLLVLDEPTLDLDFRRLPDLCDLACAMAKRGGAVIIITHDYRLLPLANRFLIFGGTHIQEFDGYETVKGFIEPFTHAQSKEDER